MGTDNDQDNDLDKDGMYKERTFRGLALDGDQQRRRVMWDPLGSGTQSLPAPRGSRNLSPRDSRGKQNCGQLGALPSCRAMVRYTQMTNETANADREIKYDSVVTVNHQHAKDAFLLDKYFAPRCRRYVLFTFGMARDLEACNSIQCWEYEKGDLLRHRVLVRNQWKSPLPRYIQLVACFTLFTLSSVSRRSWILTPHPPVLLCQRILRALKGHRFVFFIADIFQYDETRLSGVLANRYVRRCARKADHLLYLSADIEKRHHFEDDSRPGRVCKRWALGIGRRFNDDTLAKKATHLRDNPVTTIGYVGIVRSVVGLDSLIDCVAQHDGLQLDIVGEGAYCETLSLRCKELGVEARVKFHGFLSTDDVEALAKNWLCGTMLYDPDNDLYTRHTEPGKAKLYISLALPVLMTDVSYIADELKQHRAGVILQGNDPSAVMGGIEEIRADYETFAKGAAIMAHEYDYERKYDDDFNFMLETG